MTYKKQVRSGAPQAWEEFSNGLRRSARGLRKQAVITTHRALLASPIVGLPTTVDAARFAAAMLAGNKSKAGSPPRSRSGAVKAGLASAAPAAALDPANSQQPLTWLDRNQTAKTIGGNFVREAMRGPGVVRGAWHTAKDLAQTAYFLQRLQNPLDSALSPPGQSAREQLIGGAGSIAESAVQAVMHPRATVRAVGDGFNNLNKSLNPDATPQAETYGGEIRRNMEIGLNQGELAFNVGSVAYGGGEFKGLAWLARGGKAKTASHFMAEGVKPGMAEYFAETYPAKGMGHHTIPRSETLPAWLGGGPVPDAILESPFFLLKPEGITIGEMYRRHVGVDPDYHGGKVPKRHGGGRWSDKDLGWTKYDGLEKLWYGTTPLMKATVGGAAGGAGGAVGQMGGEQ